MTRESKKNLSLVIIVFAFVSLVYGTIQALKIVDRTQVGTSNGIYTSYVTTAEEIASKIRKPTIVCGELTPDERRRLARKRINVKLASPAYCVRRPALLAELAWNRWKAGYEEDAAALAPIYLHVANPIPS